MGERQHRRSENKKEREKNRSEEAKQLVDIVCERLAPVKNLTFGPFYWRDENWKKIYAHQIRQAYTLLNLYDFTCIVRALNHWKCKKVYSLYAPFLHPIIKEEQERVNRVKVKAENSAPEPSNIEIKIRKNNKKDRLEDL